MTHPLGQSFLAVILNEAGFPVLSNRNGIWEPDPHITMADLLCPEQELNEWDVVRDETVYASETISRAINSPV